jgi:hypothetical protein
MLFKGNKQKMGRDILSSRWLEEGYGPGGAIRGRDRGYTVQGRPKVLKAIWRGGPTRGGRDHWSVLN